jgi:hypothetical protein
VPLNSNALTSVANAQAWLRRNHVTGTAASDDTALLTLAINGVSAAIARYTAREFVDPSGNNTDVSRTFDYDGGGYLDFAPYDLRSPVTSITLGGAALTVSTGVGDGDYQLKPRAGTVDGTYTYLDMRGFYKLGARYTIFSPMLVHRDVVIVGKWGMTAVPADVEVACLIAVADMYRNPEQVSSRGSGDFTMSELAVNPGSEESLPPGARRLLDPFVRPKVV